MPRLNFILIALFLTHSTLAFGKETSIKLFPGFVTKIQCEGRLLVSAIGNEDLVRLEPLPKELGCGVLLKPLHLKSNGPSQTNLLLETSTGTIRKMIQVTTNSSPPGSAADLIHQFKGELL